MNERTEKLQKIMADHGLNAADVAAILGREVITVRIWLCTPGNRIIPAHQLELLQLKVAQKAD